MVLDTSVRRIDWASRLPARGSSQESSWPRVAEEMCGNDMTGVMTRR
jgi:hypothetical protein